MAPHAGADPSDYDHQLKVLGKYLEEKPGHTPVLYQMAELEISHGRYQDAQQHLQQILQREPNNVEAHLDLGRVLFQRGDVEGALQNTEFVVKAQPSNPDALYNLGAIYANIGNLQRADTYWRRLIAVAPNSDSGKLAQRSLGQLAAKLR